MMNLKDAPPMAIKDQLRHTTVATTESFYIGSDLEFQRQQIEKLILRKRSPEGLKTWQWEDIIKFFEPHSGKMTLVKRNNFVNN
jgi:hypothetical protein